MNLNATLFGQAVVFAILIAVVMKYVWPPLLAAIEERQNKIADGLHAADKARQELSAADRRVDELLAQAKAEQAQVLERAQQQAAKLLEEARAQAQADRARQVAAAADEIAAQAGKARELLKLQVASLTISGASKVLGREVDAKAHQALIDQLIAEL